MLKKAVIVLPTLERNSNYETTIRIWEDRVGGTRRNLSLYTVRLTIEGIGFEVPVTVNAGEGEVTFLLTPAEAASLRGPSVHLDLYLEQTSPARRYLAVEGTIPVANP